MFKRPRIALMLGVAIAISMIISACGGSTSSGNTPTPGSTMLGTPGEYTCVQGSITASGSTALAPLVKSVAQSYAGKCSGATITVNLGGSKTGLANVEAGSVDIGNSDVPANPQTQGDLVERHLPADWRELPLAFRADAAQWRRQPLRRMHHLGVAIDLGAGKAGGEGMIGVALDA